MPPQPLQVGILVEQRYLDQLQPAGLCRELVARGHSVILIDPTRVLHSFDRDEWAETLDLLVVRGRSWAVLCLLAWAESRALPTINSHRAISGVHNKAQMAVALAKGSIPTPNTYFAEPRQLARKLPRDAFPLLLKPIFGDNSAGLQLVRSPREMALVDWPEASALAQTYLESDGHDIKLYGVGERLWAVRKPASFHPGGNAPSVEGPREGEVLPLTPELRSLGRRCREIFGLDFYGVDCIATERGVRVLEVNEFPNYTSIPEASQALADYAVRCARVGVMS